MYDISIIVLIILGSLVLFYFIYLVVYLVYRICFIYIHNIGAEVTNE